MIIINTTFAVSRKHDAEFRRWVRDELLPLWKTADCAGELLRVLNGEEDADGTDSYALQMRFDTMETASDWQDSQFSTGIQACFKKFEGEVMPFCTVLESV